jgi:hypothetical protein
MNDRPKAPTSPRGLQTAGRRLWRAVTADYEMDEHERAVLVQACRTADLCDRLAQEAEDAPLTVTNFKGDAVANPLIVEHRQQSATLSRLIAALRLPDDEIGGRPQRRGGPRRPYRTRERYGSLAAVPRP